MSKKGKSKKRKVNNREDGKANVKNLNEPKNEEKGLKFDFSFEALYYSVRLSKGKFNNYLKSEGEFIDKFRQIRSINAVKKEISLLTVLVTPYPILTNHAMCRILLSNY